MNKISGVAIKEKYISSLADLNCNSKTLNNVLTVMAEENISHASDVVAAVEDHLAKVTPDMKLSLIYLIDRLAKKMKTYAELFSQNIDVTFWSVFRKVDKKTRLEMLKLRQTWNTIFPQHILHAIDLKIRLLNPAWQVTAQLPVNKISHNRKFLIGSNAENTKRHMDLRRTNNMKRPSTPMLGSISKRRKTKLANASVTKFNQSPSDRVDSELLVNDDTNLRNVNNTEPTLSVTKINKIDKEPNCNSQINTNQNLCDMLSSEMSTSSLALHSDGFKNNINMPGLETQIILDYKNDEPHKLQENHNVVIKTSVDSEPIEENQAQEEIPKQKKEEDNNDDVIIIEEVPEIIKVDDDREYLDFLSTSTKIPVKVEQTIDEDDGFMEVEEGLIAIKSGHQIKSERIKPDEGEVLQPPPSTDTDTTSQPALNGNFYLNASLTATATTMTIRIEVIKRKPLSVIPSKKVVLKK